MRDDAGGHTHADLARLEAEGAVEIHEPGTPEHERATREMAARLPEYNARRLAEDGPDALTSDRLLRTAGLAAERDPGTVGYALAAWCARRGWERSDLADWLDVSTGTLAALALEPRGADRLAERFGADSGRLADVLAVRAGG